MLDKAISILIKVCFSTMSVGLTLVSVCMVFFGYTQLGLIGACVAMIPASVVLALSLLIVQGLRNGNV